MISSFQSRSSRPRRFLTAGIAAVSAALPALGLAACGGSVGGSSNTSSTSGNSTSHVLNLTMDNAIPTLDPDTVYQYEGNQVLLEIYQGLAAYAPDSTSKIVPDLATSWTITSDGKTYTFHLRKGVTFDTGQQMTSADVLASFERLGAKKVGAQMGYMVAGVASYSTPDKYTFVVHLKSPQSDFLSLVASPFGPKIIAASVLKAHAADDALSYLATHADGTGPYELTTYTKDQQYVLSKRSGYWGTSQFFSKVNVSVVPDSSTEVLQLEGGGLDALTSQPLRTIEQFASKSGYKVVTFPTLEKAQLQFKITGVMSSLALRTALRDAINRQAFVKQVFGAYGKVSTQEYPSGMLDSGASDTWTTSAGDLAKLAKGKTLTLGYTANRSQDEQAVETLQAQWEADGVNVKLVAVPENDVYDLASHLASAPDMLYATEYPDSAAPDTWSRLFWYHNTASGGGALNYLLAGSTKIDSLIDAGLAATNPTVSNNDYAEAGNLIHDQVSFVTLADVDDAFIERSDLAGGGHYLPCPLTIDLDTLSRSTS